jgi:hypothetical protein
MDGLPENLRSIPLTIALPIIVLLLWRLWRFTIVPFLFPNQPRTLPYWLPGTYPGASSGK